MPAAQPKQRELDFFESRSAAEARGHEPQPKLRIGLRVFFNRPENVVRINQGKRFVSFHHGARRVIRRSRNPSSISTALKQAVSIYYAKYGYNDDYIVTTKTQRNCMSLESHESTPFEFQEQVGPRQP
jgi:hypothetical protein